MRDEDLAEEFVADNHVFTGGLALGIECGNGFWHEAYAIRPYMHGVFVGAYRIRPTAMDAKNHCRKARRRGGFVKVIGYGL